MNASLKIKFAFSLVAVVLSWWFFKSLCMGGMLMAGYIRPPNAVIGWRLAMLCYGISVAFSSIFICWCLTGRRIHLAGLVIPLLVLVVPLFTRWDIRGNLHQIFPYRCWLLLICGIFTNVLIAATWVLVAHFSNRASRRLGAD